MRARKVSKKKSIVKKEKGFFSDKRKIGLVFVGLFLIVLMVSSMLISNDDENSTEYEYNGFYFVQIDGYWNVAYGDQTFSFVYDPLSLENLTMEDIDLKVEKVYVGFVPGEENMGSNSYQRALSLMKAIVPTALPACFEEEGCPDLPLVDCNGENKIIWLKEGESDKIYNEDQCIIFEYLGDANKILDLFTYKLLGVM